MAKKITTKDFIEKAKLIHGNKYNYEKTNYIKNKEKVVIFCNKCKKYFEQTPNNHLSGDGCPYCRYKTKSTEQFINDAKKVHGDLYDYSDVIYIKNDKKVKILCKNCNKYFYQTPHNHLQKRGCPYCSKSKGEISISNYLKKSNIKFETQKRFDNCKNINRLPFDFYLPEHNVCIEYQGKQHYEIDFYLLILKSEKLAKERLEKQKNHDNIKREFCKNNGIKLLEIKYTDNIKEVLKQELEGFTI